MDILTLITFIVASGIGAYIGSAIKFFFENRRATQLNNANIAAIGTSRLLNEANVKLAQTEAAFHLEQVRASLFNDLQEERTKAQEDKAICEKRLDSLGESHEMLKSRVMMLEGIVKSTGGTIPL